MNGRLSAPKVGHGCVTLRDFPCGCQILFLLCVNWLWNEITIFGGYGQINVRQSNTYQYFMIDLYF